MVTTPVGARCRECARLYVLPTYRLSTIYYLRAAGAALGTAVVIGLAWGFLRYYLGSLGPIATLLIGYGVGMAVAFITGLAVNRKRGTWLAVIGGAAVLACFGLVELVYSWRYGSFSGSSYTYIMTGIGALLGIVVVVYRLR
ncbi:MAG: hypothetical protein A2Y92_01770 [Chloroflexi bacterium RBG_13_57_8]|nr:MAG: hypothetical protein A2Y92_01770 [Chloroflexi bacterium RBG_13_57_8]